MAIVADRAKETSTTTGTGNLTLSGAASGFQDLNTAVGLNVLFTYAIVHQSADEWEVGEGYLSGTSTLVRNRVTESNNANALVNLSAGTKDVFITLSADQFKGKGTAYAIALGYAMP